MALLSAVDALGRAQKASKWTIFLQRLMMRISRTFKWCFLLHRRWLGTACLECERSPVSPRNIRCSPPPSLSSGQKDANRAARAFPLSPTLLSLFSRREKLVCNACHYCEEQRQGRNGSDRERERQRERVRERV